MRIVQITDNGNGTFTVACTQAPEPEALTSPETFDTYAEAIARVDSWFGQSH